MEISDKHVEWAVVNRLKAMLDAPPKTEFNVTQAFAMFATIVLWTKNRAWVGGNFDLSKPPEWLSKVEGNIKALEVRRKLIEEKMFEPPWLLSKESPYPRHGDRHSVDAAGGEINSDFEGMNAGEFINWLRDVLAHGDGRNITPLHTPQKRNGKALLIGFKIVTPAQWASIPRRTLSLYRRDMVQIGGAIADAFCKELSGDDKLEAGTVTITEAA